MIQNASVTSATFEKVGPSRAFGDLFIDGFLACKKDAGIVTASTSRRVRKLDAL